MVCKEWRMSGHQVPDGEDASQVGNEPPAGLCDGSHVCTAGSEQRGELFPVGVVLWGVVICACVA